METGNRTVAQAASHAAGDVPASAVFRDGSSYVGPLDVYLRPDGRGLLRRPNGDEYEGGFVQGLPHGQLGKYTFAEATPVIPSAAAAMLEGVHTMVCDWELGHAMATCAECDSPLAATQHCQQCDTFFCDPHAAQMHQMRITQSHRRRHIPHVELEPMDNGASSSRPDDAGRAASSRACVAASSEPVPSVPSPLKSALGVLPAPVSARGVVLVVDYLSFVWAVRRSTLAVFVCALLQGVRDMGAVSISKLLFLMGGELAEMMPTHTRDVEAEMPSLCIEQIRIEWSKSAEQGGNARPRLLPHRLQELQQATDHTDPDSLIVLASSRPERFVDVVEWWMTPRAVLDGQGNPVTDGQGRPTGAMRSNQLMLIHGLGKQPHSLPLDARHSRMHVSDDVDDIEMVRRMIEQRLTEDAAQQRQQQQSTVAGVSPLPAWLERTLSAVFELLSSMWPVLASPNGDLPTALQGDRSRNLIGVQCVWDAPVWQHMEAKLEAKLENAVTAGVMPLTSCPLWNAGMPCDCSKSRWSFPHLCQACGQGHRLVHCHVNSFHQLPSKPLAQRLSGEQFSALLQWFRNTYGKMKRTPFRMASHQHRVRGQLTAGASPSSTVPIVPRSVGAAGRVACAALIYVDWQNVHVPQHEVERFLTGLVNFAGASWRSDVSEVRAMHVLLDRTMLGDVAATMDRLSATPGMPPLDVVSVEARKVQQIDSRLTMMLRTEPRAAVTGTRGADLVMVVSGDSDFSPDMARLVMLGHRVLLVHNTQARVQFKTCPLWEEAIDYMDLPELASYKAMKMQQRHERKRMAHSALQRGITMRVASLQLHDGDFAQRVPGLSGMCLDPDGRALLIADSVRDLIWRYTLPAAGSSEARAGVLEPFAGRGSQQSVPLVHYIICVNSSSSMAEVWPDVHLCLEVLKAALAQESVHQRAADMASLLLFSDTVTPLQAQPVPVMDLPGLPMHTCGEANFRSLLTYVQELLQAGYGRERRPSRVELLLITEGMTTMVYTLSLLSEMLFTRHSHADAVTGASDSFPSLQPSSASHFQLSCSVLMPSSLYDPMFERPVAGLDGSSSRDRDFCASLMRVGAHVLHARLPEAYADYDCLAARAREWQAATQQVRDAQMVGDSPSGANSPVVPHPSSPPALLSWVRELTHTCPARCMGASAAEPLQRYRSAFFAREYVALVCAHRGTCAQPHLRELAASLSQEQIRVPRFSPMEGPLRHALLCRPTELVADPATSFVFVCDTGHDRIAVLERATHGCMFTLRMEAALAEQQQQQHRSDDPPMLRIRPRYLFLDARHRRLWLTDLHTQRMGFVQLDRLRMPSSADVGIISAPFVFVSISNLSKRALPPRPTSKCLAANGRDLLFCDQASEAFFRMDMQPHMKLQVGPVHLRSGEDVRVCHIVTEAHLVHQWREPGVGDDAPPPSFHSLMLDRDGSYLFCDSTSHTIKRLVALYEPGADAADDSDSAGASLLAASLRWRVSLVAGKGQGGMQDGEARDARFKFPGVLLSDPSEVGSILISELGNRRLRKLYVAHDADGGSMHAGLGGSAGGDMSGSDELSSSRGKAPFMRMRAHFKTRPCKHYQKGQCRFMAESDKCSFLHQCSRCGGPHGESRCQHRAFMEQHAYMTQQAPEAQGLPPQSAHGGQVRTPPEPQYVCQLCHVLCGPINRAVQHITSNAHIEAAANIGWALPAAASAIPHGADASPAPASQADAPPNVPAMSISHASDDHKYDDGMHPQPRHMPEGCAPGPDSSLLLADRAASSPQQARPPSLPDPVASPTATAFQRLLDALFGKHAMDAYRVRQSDAYHKFVSSFEAARRAMDASSSPDDATLRVNVPRSLESYLRKEYRVEVIDRVSEYVAANQWPSHGDAHEPVTLRFEEDDGDIVMSRGFVHTVLRAWEQEAQRYKRADAHASAPAVVPSATPARGSEHALPLSASISPMASLSRRPTGFVAVAASSAAVAQAPSHRQPSPKRAPSPVASSDAHSSVSSMASSGSLSSSPSASSSVHVPAAAPAAAPSPSVSASAPGPHAYHCSLCQQSFNSPAQLDQHEKGKPHLGRVAGAPGGGFQAAPPRELVGCLRCRSAMSHLPPEPGLPDRRPLVLPECGHTFCAECVYSVFQQASHRVGGAPPTFPKCIECGSAIVCALHQLPPNRALMAQLQAAAVARAEAAAAQDAQHEQFIAAHPYMQEQVPRHASKQRSYKCDVCKLPVGPIHRALAHALVPELRAKHSEWVRTPAQQPTQAPHGHATRGHSPQRQTNAQQHGHRHSQSDPTVQQGGPISGMPYIAPQLLSPQHSTSSAYHHYAGQSAAPLSHQSPPFHTPPPSFTPAARATSVPFMHDMLTGQGSGFSTHAHPTHTAAPQYYGMTSHGKPIHVGPRGGIYTLTSGGHPSYLPRAQTRMADPHHTHHHPSQTHTTFQHAPQTYTHAPSTLPPTSAIKPTTGVQVLTPILPLGAQPPQGDPRAAYR